MIVKHNLKVFISLLLLFFIKTSYGVFHPFIFVPGDGGSQVEAKLNKSSAVHYICGKTSTDYFNIWLNLELLVPVVIDCWIDNIKLVYNNETRKTENTPGVDIRIPGFGGTETVEWLDPSHASSGAYFKDIANELVGLGHVRNVTLKGAPYDFRKAPNENQDYFIQLKDLIEKTYNENNQTSVILLAHSMGGPMTQYFLNMQKQSWKDKYIKSLVALSGAWGGSVKAVKVYAIGDDLGSYVLNQRTMKQEQITNPSLAWLMPSSHFWQKDEVLVETDIKNYTLANIEEYFIDVDYPDGWEMYKDTQPHSLSLGAPGVEVHCLYGTDVPTVEKLIYKPGKFYDTPSFVNGDGDGTVNRRSLEGCMSWVKQQKQRVYARPLPKVDHMSILSNPNVLQYIANLVNTI
ncbi:lysosomal phospholipase A and acyltransferase-like [Onthophagus taurus]|uniref:lysosomal phospholipase A and acyltransferase-like n=1 Tax=Onthophagus taurus TaxID=166361 RepID=UPI000C20A605|nr:group XV phospholipase A2-like [Onthophagus taurus]